MKRKHRRPVPTAKIRQRLEERLQSRYGNDFFEQIEEKDKGKGYGERFPIAQLRWMHEKMMIKTTIALLIVSLIGIYIYFNMPFAELLAERVDFYANRDLDLRHINEDLIPVVAQLWERDYVEPPFPEKQQENKEKENQDASYKNLIFPVDGEVITTFGLRKNYETGRKEMHYGLGMTAFSGEPVVAALTGIVDRITTHPQKGIMIYIRHSEVLRTIYARMSKAVVEDGENVSAGEKIGYAGGYGQIYFEMRVEGRPVDPGLYLQ